MRIPILFLLFLCHNAFACDSENQNEKLAFAVEIKREQSLEEYLGPLRLFQVQSSIQKGNMFLQAITILVKNEMYMDLDVTETGEYKGDFYTSYFSIADKHVKDIVITLSYNATNKERTGFAMCGNWVNFTLSELLENPKAEKAPSLSSPP